MQTSAQLVDARGSPVSGATPRALAAYEAALAAFVAWRGDPGALLGHALEDAPGFVQARVLSAYLLLGNRDPRRVTEAAPWLVQAAALPATPQERLHLAAIGRALADDFEGAVALLDDALDAQPRDVLALAVAGGLDHRLGEAARLRERVERVLPAWPSDLPGYHAVRAMHAFGLVECGDDAQAEDAALAALALEPRDARAHHAMAHVFEMSDRPDAGIRWMNAHAETWGGQTAVAVHCRWHLALFHLARGDADAALALYDRHLRAGGSRDVADLIDAAALLWRLHLHGADAGARWFALAAQWDAHIDDAFCSFNDLHAMMAFVGARDWSRAQRLEQSLLRSQSQPGRHGETTRQLGLSACRGLMAYGRGEHARAIALFANVPQRMHRLGGSHAQRDVLHLTLMRAIGVLRRPARRAQHAKQIRPLPNTRLQWPVPRFATS